MDRELATISSETNVAELVERIARWDAPISKHLGLLILDADGTLEGVVARSDILRAFEKGSEGRMSVLDAGTRNVASRIRPALGVAPSLPPVKLCNTLNVQLPLEFGASLRTTPQPP